MATGMRFTRVVIRGMGVGVHEIDTMKDIGRRPINGSLILVACYLVVLSWAELLGLIAVMTVGFATHSQALTTPVIALLGTLIVTAAIYVGIALIVRCSSCGRRMLIEAPGFKHPTAKKVFGLDLWASSIISILRNGHLNCMYCGAEHIVQRSSRR